MKLRKLPSHQQKALELLSGWLTAIKQQAKGIRRKNKLIRRLRGQNEGLKHNSAQALIYLKVIKEEECNRKAWDGIENAAEFLEP